ncbi:MAG TPA: globin [Chloroflexota bacterium]|nr:globin [Chloroflexota bacterium]
MTVYEAVGGEKTFTRLVDTFYAEVEKDPILRPLYPDDLGPPRRHLTLFLIQYFGGPRTYLAERGHPRLRARHMAFPIDQKARDAWVRCMRVAVESLDLPAATRDAFMRYFEEAATFLINR